MSNTDLTSWLALASTQGVGPARLQRVAQILHDRRVGASSLIGASPEMLSTLGLAPILAERAAKLLANPIAPPAPPPGSVLLCPDDERYPHARMLHAAPPLPAMLYAAGDVGLLSFSPTIAIVGSRQASNETLAAARDIARAAVALGRLVVSGLAHGVDEVAHGAVLQSGGATIAVLAEGIVRSKRAQQIIATPTGDVLVVSEFAPSDEWTPGRAMQRNSTVAALADAVVVIASDIRGGTWEMGQLCLKYKKPLLAVDFEATIAPGNHELIRSGALPLDPHRLHDDLEQHLHAGDPGSEAVGQESLFGM